MWTEEITIEKWWRTGRKEYEIKYQGSCRLGNPEGINITIENYKDFDTRKEARAEIKRIIKKLKTGRLFDNVA